MTGVARPLIWLQREAETEIEGESKGMGGVEGLYTAITWNVPADARLHEEGTVPEQLQLRTGTGIEGPAPVLRDKPFRLL